MRHVTPTIKQKKEGKLGAELQKAVAKDIGKSLLAYFSALSLFLLPKYMEHFSDRDLDPDQIDINQAVDMTGVRFWFYPSKPKAVDDDDDGSSVGS